MYNSDIAKQYIDMYKRMHVEHEWNKNQTYGYGDGKPVADNRSQIRFLLRKYDVSSVLDYGCGKAAHHLERNVYSEIFDIHDVGLYDPAIEAHSILPDRIYDAVVCTDVLEHIPLVNIDHTLQEINSRVSKLVFFTTCQTASKVLLPSGENAHITRKTAKWWRKKIMENSKDGVQYYMVHDKMGVKVFWHINAGAKLQSS